MLQFFRKYQKILFLLTTVVIVVSFSFFGTYQAMWEDSRKDPVAFLAVNGEKVSRSSLEEMTFFLGSDREDKLLLGGIWGPNFLNDGVVKKDFLETGFLAKIAFYLRSEVEGEMAVRHAKEKAYSAYIHPRAPFIRAENAWSVVAPELTKHYQALKKANDPLTKEAIEARVKLYLAERAFPAPALRMVIRHQEKQYKWVDPDPDFYKKDLSLFGYHWLDDWFGPTLMRRVSQVVINGALLAKERGYKVSSAEALADLINHARLSFDENSRSPHLGVVNAREYFEAQLRRMGLDQARAVAIWRQVLLFRRLMQDVQSGVFVDSIPFAPSFSMGGELIRGDLYSPPEGMRFGDLNTVKQFELYLTAIGDRSEEEKKGLLLPVKFYATEEVKRKTPELLKKRYLVKLKSVSKKSLGAKVSLQQMWDWQANEQNWALLLENFSELGVPGKEDVAPYAVLDTVNRRTRARVDAFTRDQVVDAHPECVAQVLEEAEGDRTVLHVRYEDAIKELGGVVADREFRQKLDQRDTIDVSSPDRRYFYRVEILDRSPSDEVITFAEAKREGVLEKLAVQAEGDDRWEAYLQALKKRIERVYMRDHPEITLPDFLSEYVASMRFYPYAREMHRRLASGDLTVPLYQTRSDVEGDRLSPPLSLANQWSLQRKEISLDRTSVDLKDQQQYFNLEKGGWSSIFPGANGAISFFHLLERSVQDTNPQLVQSVLGVQEVLGHEVLNLYFDQILEKVLSNPILE